MDPVSFMEREISQLVKTDVAYKDRLFIGNVHLVCPHHKCLDLMGSWEAPNKSTLQGMGPVHASKASRRGLRLDHLFNEREGSHGARGRLERDMQTYWGTLKALDVSEAELLTKARENSKIQKHVIGFIEAAQPTEFNMEMAKFKLAPGDLLLFPSWLKHGSGFEANQSALRVMISLNAGA